MPVYITSEELYEFVLMRTKNAVERPRMYAEGPQCLETYLSLLDEIMCVIVQADPHKHGFATFLREHGYGSAGVCYRSRIDGESPTDVELTARVVSVWCEYRMSQFAPMRETDGAASN